MLRFEMMDMTYHCYESYEKDHCFEYSDMQSLAAVRYSEGV